MEPVLISAIAALVILVLFVTKTPKKKSELIAESVAEHSSEQGS